MATMQQALQKLMEQKERIDRRRRKIQRRELFKARIKRIFLRLFDWSNL